MVMAFLIDLLRLYGFSFITVFIRVLKKTIRI
jgi:hypothetical protein